MSGVDHDAGGGTPLESAFVAIAWYLAELNVYARQSGIRVAYKFSISSSYAFMA